MQYKHLNIDWQWQLVTHFGWQLGGIREKCIIISLLNGTFGLRPRIEEEKMVLHKHDSLK